MAHFLQKCRRPVRRAVINEDQLVGAAGVPQHTLQALARVRFLVAAEDDDRRQLVPDGCCFHEPLFCRHELRCGTGQQASIPRQAALTGLIVDFPQRPE